MRTTLNVDTTQWPEMWKAAYRLLEQSIVPNQLQAWIQPLELLESELKDNVLKVRLAAPNDFSAQWVRDHYRRNIETAFAQIMGAPCELQLIVKEGVEELSSHEGATFALEPTLPEAAHQGFSGNSGASTAFLAPPSAAGPAHGVSSGVVLNSGSRAIAESGLDPRYTFESYVVGASNQFAHASAVAVAEQPARQYNPLFIYSPPGLGKTHLLHAIGNHLLAKKPNSRVAYLSAEKFVNELIESVQHRRMSQFRAKYRDSYDMILIDDIQFIAGKSTSEEEFFHTFNALYGSKRQIVLTSDRSPKEIEGLEERIRTRFEWGLVADITVPEIETRIAILRAKAERDDIYLPDDVATFLATYIKTNVRELEGVLIRLQAQASLSGAEISLEMAKQELKTQVPEEGSNFTIENIQGAVAKHFHLKVQDLKSATRARPVALPRQIAMYLIRKYTGLGYKEIGQYFGGKDHSTIMHGCKKIETELETDSKMRDAVEAIQNLL
ncbi:MAG: chromosomal replication initiator protein DnaA [Oligoflexia bacterium]|nr:chromosomal replication initiator protein DnaA [Oligoflexia bacterium]